MAFCKGGLAAVKKIVHHITDELEKIIEFVTEITGKIKALEASPAVEAILAIIPGGHVAEAWFNTALDELTGGLIKADTLAEKIQAWLDSFDTEPAKNAGIFKLASLAAKAADTKPDPSKGESFYDSAVQLHVMDLKG